MRPIVMEERERDFHLPFGLHAEETRIFHMPQGFIRKRRLDQPLELPLALSSYLFIASSF